MNNRFEGWWRLLVGDDSQFTFENITFNALCVITAPVIVYAILVDMVLAQYAINLLYCSILCVLAAVYYNSRFRNKYQSGIFVYSLVSYITLIVNYFYNGGIQGPTLLIFLMMFQLLISISNARSRYIYLFLHVLIAIALLIVEARYPDSVKIKYPNTANQLLDQGFTYLVALSCLFAATSYFRRTYEDQKILALSRQQALEEQHVRIVSQNKQLERLNDEKNKLFSIISHDLREPLNSVKSYLDLLSEELLDGEEKQTLEHELAQQMLYTNKLLTNLLFWSRAQMSNSGVQLAHVNVSQLVNEARAYKEQLADRKGIRITYLLADNAIAIADPDMLSIVMRNLINNAIKFTRTGGEVVVEVSNEAERIRMEVRDNGIGIPLEKQQAIFSLGLYSRYGTGNEKGAGLGLTLCKQLVEQQHGVITFTSTVDVGTSFYVWLPSAN